MRVLLVDDEVALATTLAAGLSGVGFGVEVVHDGGAGLARAQGATGFGPVKHAADLGPAFADAIAVVEAGGVAVVDVRVAPGYTPAMASALVRHDK